jgi:hypothetical protein
VHIPEGVGVTVSVGVTDGVLVILGVIEGDAPGSTDGGGVSAGVPVILGVGLGEAGLKDVDGVLEGVIEGVGELDAPGVLVTVGVGVGVLEIEIDGVLVRLGVGVLVIEGVTEGVLVILGVIVGVGGADGLGRKKFTVCACLNTTSISLFV